MKNGSTLVESDKVNFRNKRRKYRDLIEQTKQNKGDDENSESQPKKGKALVHANVEIFFRDHNIRKSENGVKIGGKIICVSYKDLVNDLTMNNTRTATNLSDGQINDVLAKLNKISFPVGYMRSEKIKTNTKI